MSEMEESMESNAGIIANIPAANTLTMKSKWVNLKYIHLSIFLFNLAKNGIGNEGCKYLSRIQWL